MIQNNKNLRANEYQFGKIKVSLEQNNIVKIENVDAIVNASDICLSNDGGVSNSILKACGQQEFAKECREYLIKKNVQLLQVGDCAVTSSCQLQKNKIKFIFHCPGPTYDINKVELCKKQLRMTIENILTRTQELKLKSVAIPAISTGYYEFPERLCAVIFQEILQNNKVDNELLVRLVLYDSDTFKIFCDAFKNHKPIFFSFDYTVKPSNYSFCVVQLEWQYQKDKAGNQIIITNMINTILKESGKNTLIWFEQQLKQKIDKNDLYTIQVLQTDKLKQIYFYPFCVVVGFQKLNEAEEQKLHQFNQEENVEQRLFNLFLFIFSSIQFVKLDEITLISIPLIDLAAKIMKKEKLSDEDKLMAFKSFQNAQLEAKTKFQIQLNSNIITDKESQNLIQDYLNKDI